MTSTILLACAETDQGSPACLLPAGRHSEGSLLGRLAVLARRYGEVVVLTRPGWEDALAGALREEAAVSGTAVAEVLVLEMTDASAGLRHLAERAEAAAAADPPTGLTVLHAHLAADDAALVPLLDGQGGSVVLTRGSAVGTEELERLDRSPVFTTGHRVSEPLPPAASLEVPEPLQVAGGARVRTVRGRVVASCSPGHALGQATDRAAGVLHVAARDVPAAAVVCRELAAGVGGRAGSEASAGSAGDGGGGPDAPRVPPSGHIGRSEGGEAPGSPPSGKIGRPEAGGAVDPPDAVGVEPAVTTDLLAWLLVGLVRSGVPVSARPAPRRSIAALVTTTGPALEAARRIAHLDVEAVRLDDSVKRDDGFFTTFLVSSYSPRLVRIAAMAGLTPDAVTGLSMLVGVLAALAFSMGEFAWMFAGAVLLQVAFLLDCVDGQLARFLRRFTVRGAWLDSMFDRGKEYLVYVGLAVGGIRAGDDATLWVLAGAALAVQTFRHTLDLGYAAQQAADVEREVRRPLLDPRDAGPGFWEIGHGEEPGAADGGEEPGAADGGEEPGAAAAHAPIGSTAGGSAASTARGATARISRWAIGALRRAEHVSLLKWAKRIVVLPIGERFALLSVLAVVTTVRNTFVVLLVWSAFAALYTAGGRIIRSLA